MNSLLYPDQVKEYRHDMHRIALNIISTAVSAWVFGRALPAHHERLRSGEGPKHHKVGRILATVHFSHGLLGNLASRDSDKPAILTL